MENLIGNEQNRVMFVSRYPSVYSKQKVRNMTFNQHGSVAAKMEFGSNHYGPKTLP